MSLRVYFFIFHFISLHIMCIPGFSFAHFGKFKVKLLAMDKCKGPKNVDCCSMDWNIHEENVLHINMNVFSNIQHLKAKITVSTNGKSLVRLQMNKVCENMFMKPFLQNLFNFTDDCIVLKGKYVFTVDIESALQKYYGGEFFYGNVSIHSIMNNNQCNFSCTIIKAVLLPK